MTAMVESNALLEEARELDRTDPLAGFRSLESGPRTAG